MSTIRTLLVANRGEIARRIFRSARRLGIRTAAVYSRVDEGDAHVDDADLAVPLDGNGPREGYLSIEALLDAARRVGADAVHPGYGFLAESAEFADACREFGLVFVGPSPDAIRLMGSKVAAKQQMEAAGVPTLAYVTVTGDDGWSDAAASVGFPMLVKASAGGGGKGMRLVENADQLDEAVTGARREAASSFGDDTVFLERWLPAPRHIEVQVFGDEHGNVVHLHERDCSIQRRHQKVVEEAPAPGLTDHLREALCDAAVRAARAIGYHSAGTVEFLVEGHEFFFLEMNTRIQVEHPVTEMITRCDLVELQLRVAAGEPLGFTQQDVNARGHAIEVRLYAEDPGNDFLPSPGPIHVFEPAAGEGIRWDTGVVAGSRISPHYDPLIAKLIVHGATRDAAMGRLRDALARTTIIGTAHNRDFLVRVVASDAFARADLRTDFLTAHAPELVDRTSDRRYELHSVAASLVALRRAHRTTVAVAVPPGWRNVPAAPLRDIWECAEGRAIVVDLERSRSPVFDDDGRGELVAVIDGVPMDVRVVSLETSHDEPGPDDIASVVFEADGLRHRCVLRTVDQRWHVRSSIGQTELSQRPRFPAQERHADASSPVAPLPGTIVAVEVEAGDRVDEGTTLVVLEAMKMEHRIVAPHAATVEQLPVAVGDAVDAHQILVVLSDLDGG